MPKLSVHGTISRSTGRLPLTGAEWAIVAVFAVASFALFGLNAVDAAANNRAYLGAAGATAQDSMQYLAWATDAAHHGLIANLYGFNNGGHVFFHPIWLVTGLLHVDAGVSYLLLLGLWQAAALILLVIVLRRYAQLVLGNDGRARAIALTLALFLVSPFFLFVVNLQLQAQRRPVDVAADRRELRRPVDQRLLPDRARGHRDDRLPDRAGAADGDASTGRRSAPSCCSRRVSPPPRSVRPPPSCTPGREPNWRS